MKKLTFIIFSLLIFICSIKAQGGEWEILISRVSLKLEYPFNDIYSSTRKLSREIMNSHIGGMVCYKYMISDKFGIFSDLSVYGNRFNDSKLQENYSTTGSNETYATSVSYGMGLSNRIKLYKDLKFNINYGIVGQVTNSSNFFFDFNFDNKVYTYDISRGSGIGYKIKLELQYPLYKSKTNIVFGYHINNTYLTHNINSTYNNGGLSYARLNYTTNLSYLYQNFCIGLQF